MDKEITRDDVNKWLKENEDQTYDEFVKEYVDTVDLMSRYSEKLTEYRQKNDSLKEALIDIREYVNEHEYCNFGHIDGDEADEIYKIIDKVLDLDKVRGE